MQIHLATVSSFATQIGLLAAFSAHVKDNPPGQKNLILIFQYPTPSDPSSLLSLPSDDFARILSADKQGNINCRCFKLDVDSLFLRFCLLPLFLVYSFLSRKLDLYLWQTRPNWLEDTYHLRSIPLRLKFNHKKIILFGDGFLNYVPTRIPPWLVGSTIKRKKSFAQSNQSDIHASYHLFTLALGQNDESKKIHREDIIPLISDVIDSNSYLISELKKIFLSFKASEIILFPYTTFFETSRCLLEDELKMYMDYLKLNFGEISSPLLLKPHPATCIEKYSCFVNLISKSLPSLSLIGIDNYNSSSKQSIASIPLECIVTYLVEFKSMQPSRIMLVSCSTASLSVKTLYPDIQVKQAFGEKLIRRYIHDAYVVPRLDQERALSSYY
jgi:hypothetical protein